MKRITWKRWLAIAGISAVLVGGAGIWAMNHAADFILKSLGEQPVEQPRSESVKKPESNKEQLEQTNNGKGESERKDGVLAQSTAQEEQDGAVAPSTVQPGVSAGPVEPSPGSGNGKKEDFAYSAEIPTDKAEKVQEEVTAQEKAFVMTTILKKFSPEELNLFMRLTSGGLSLEEKKEAKKIFLRKLNEEEYDRLIAIASKYGLSQGRSYQDNLKNK